MQIADARVGDQDGTVRSVKDEHAASRNSGSTALTDGQPKVIKTPSTTRSNYWHTNASRDAFSKPEVVPAPFAIRINRRYHYLPRPKPLSEAGGIHRVHSGS
jgi:hypothetical protein